MPETIKRVQVSLRLLSVPTVIREHIKQALVWHTRYVARCVIQELIKLDLVFFSLLRAHCVMQARSKRVLESGFHYNVPFVMLVRIKLGLAILTL